MTTSFDRSYEVLDPPTGDRVVAAATSSLNLDLAIAVGRRANRVPINMTVQGLRRHGPGPEVNVHGTLVGGAAIEVDLTVDECGEPARGLLRLSPRQRPLPRRRRNRLLRETEYVVVALDVPRVAAELLCGETAYVVAHPTDRPDDLVAIGFAPSELSQPPQSGWVALRGAVEGDCDLNMVWSSVAGGWMRISR